MKHRWGPKVYFPLANKTECECTRGCGTVKVSRHEVEGGREIHWSEFWRDGERIEGGTPACDPPAKSVRYEARGYPL